MSDIERCWVWEHRSPMDDEVRRGVMFHEPDASVAMLDSVEEFVPADQLAGAVEGADRLREVLRAVLMEPDPIKRNQLAAPVLTNRFGGSSTMNVIEPDEREDAYEHGYRVGVARERERAVKEGVFKELGEAYFAQRDQLRKAIDRIAELEAEVARLHRGWKDCQQLWIAESRRRREPSERQ